MAIEEFGQSLLSQQRQRQQRANKEKRRAQREMTLGAIGGAIGNQYLKSKAEDFLNNESFRAELVQMSRAAKEYEKTEPLYEEMLKQNKSSLQYFEDNLMSQADSRVKEILQNDELASLPEVQEMVRNEIRSQAQAQAAAFDNVRKYGAELVSPETAIAARKQLAKENIPSNIGEAAANWVVNLFKPENKKSMEYNVLLASQQNRYKNNLDAFNLANAAFNSGRGLGESFEIADAVANLEKGIMSAERNDEFRTLLKSDIKYQGTGTEGMYKKIITKTYYDRRLDKDIEISTVAEDVVDFRTEEGKAKVFQDAMLPFSSPVYLAPLTNQAQVELVKTDGFILKPKSKEEYEQSYNIYKQIVSNTNNIKPDYAPREAFDLQQLMLQNYVRKLFDTNTILNDEYASEEQQRNAIQSLADQLSGLNMFPREE